MTMAGELLELGGVLLVVGRDSYVLGVSTILDRGPLVEGRHTGCRREISRVVCGHIDVFHLPLSVLFEEE